MLESTKLSVSNNHVKNTDSHCSVHPVWQLWQRWWKKNSDVWLQAANILLQLGLCVSTQHLIDQNYPVPSKPLRYQKPSPSLMTNLPNIFMINLFIILSILLNSCEMTVHSHLDFVQHPKTLYLIINNEKSSKSLHLSNQNLQMLYICIVDPQVLCIQKCSSIYSLLWVFIMQFHDIGL